MRRPGRCQKMTLISQSDIPCVWSSQLHCTLTFGLVSTTYMNRLLGLALSTHCSICSSSTQRALNPASGWLHRQMAAWNRQQGLTHWPLGKFEWNFRYLIFKWILVIDDWGISCENSLIWMSLDFTDDQSTLDQVMAWCCQATSHYLSQCWPRSLSPYGVTRPQWVNSLVHGRSVCQFKNVISVLVLLIRIFRHSHDDTLWWMPQDLTFLSYFPGKHLIWSQDILTSNFTNGYFSSSQLLHFKIFNKLECHELSSEMLTTQ